MFFPAINLNLYPVATSGEDFSPPASALQAAAFSFGPGRPLCFDVAIMEDDLVEEEECFMVDISLPASSADLGVSIADGQATALCCIQDDDRE